MYSYSQTETRLCDWNKRRLTRRCASHLQAWFEAVRMNPSISMGMADQGEREDVQCVCTRRVLTGIRYVLSLSVLHKHRPSEASVRVGIMGKQVIIGHE